MVLSHALILGMALPAATAKVVADFEAPAELAACRADPGVKFALSNKHAISGARSLAVTFPAGTRRICIEPRQQWNWLSHDRLAIDLYNGSQERVSLMVRIEDARGKTLEKKHNVPAIVAMRVELVLNQQHWLDLSKVKRIALTVDGLKAPAQVFFDNVRVVSARPKLALGPQGGMIQAEDFTRSNCMINPSGWGRRRNDTPIIQGGVGGPFWAEWDFQLAKPGRYQLDVKHAALNPRSCRVLVDGHVLHTQALAQTTGSWEGFTAKWFTVARVHLDAGKHTLRMDRGGASPHIDAIRLSPTQEPLLWPFMQSRIGALLRSVQKLEEGIRQIPPARPSKAPLAERIRRRRHDIKSLRTAALSPDALERRIVALRDRLAQLRRDGFRLISAAQMNVPEAAVRYALAVETSLTKVFPEFDKLSAAPARRVEIKLAANEYESAQAIVVPLAGALSRVAVSASDLECKSTGARIASANIRLHRVGFVEADSGGTASQPGMRWPDPLLPNAAFDVPADEVRPVWITAYAPKGTPAGTYQGALTFEPARERPTKLPLVLNVYGFELEDETHVKTTFFLPIRWSKMSRQEVLRWMDYAMAYRIGIMDIGWGWTAAMASRIKKNADGSYDFSRMEKDLEYVFARHMNSVSLGDTPFSMADKSEAGKREMVRCLRAYAKLIKAKGWWDRCYYKLPDEPGDREERLAKVKVVADLVKQADPDYARLCTVKVREDMFGYVDVWCPLLSWHNDEIYAKARARGDKIWMYTCCGPRPPWANIAFIDQEAIAHRILMWTCWRFNYGGYLYWGIKFWPSENFDKDGKPLWPEKPWHSRIRRLPAGDGYMSYPDKHGGPLPCIRIELFRDGVEDYEYHYLLKKTLGGRKDAQADKLLKLTYEDEVCPDGQHYTRDPQRLLRRRDALAAAIQRLKP